MHQDATCMDVCLSPGDFVLDADPAPLPKREPPIFFPRLLWPNGWWINMPLGTEVGVGLRDIVLDGDPAPPPLKGHSPQFSSNVRCGQTAG